MKKSVLLYFKSDIYKLYFRSYDYKNKVLIHIFPSCLGKAACWLGKRGACAHSQCELLHYCSRSHFLTNAPTLADPLLNFLELSYQKALTSGLNSCLLPFSEKTSFYFQCSWRIIIIITIIATIITIITTIIIIIIIIDKFSFPWS